MRRFRPVRVPRLASRVRPTRLRWLRAQQGVRAAGTRVFARPRGGAGFAGRLAGLRSFVLDVDPPADAFQDVFATLYHNLGIDVNRATVTDLSGRPHFIVDGHQPMKELI